VFILVEGHILSDLHDHLNDVITIIAG